MNVPFGYPVRRASTNTEHPVLFVYVNGKCVGGFKPENKTDPFTFEKSRIATMATPFSHDVAVATWHTPPPENWLS